MENELEADQGEARPCGLQPPAQEGGTRAKAAFIRCSPGGHRSEELAAAVALLADNPEATGKEVADVLGVPERSGRRYRTKALKVVAAANGHKAAATSAATNNSDTERAEDITETATGHTDAEDLAESGHDLMDHNADMPAVS